MSKVLLEALLAPIPGAKRTGSSMRNSVLYRQIPQKFSAESDDVIATDFLDRNGTGAPKSRIDFDGIATEVAAALRDTTKDLQLAVWLSRALLGRDGLPGLTYGIELIAGLLSNYWEDLYPPLEGEDLSARASILSRGLDSVLHQLKALPLTKNGDNYEPERPPDRIAIIASVSSGQELEKAAAQIEAAAESFSTFSGVADEKFGPGRLDLEPLKTFFEGAKSFIDDLLAAKRPRSQQQEPKKDAPADEALVSKEVAAGTSGREPEADDPRKAIASQLKRLRSNEPNHPSAYLALRSLFWPALVLNGFEERRAPDSSTRRELESLFKSEKWEALLDRSEEVFSKHCEFLDLQRYSATASRELGYENIAEAIEHALKELLQRVPAVLNAAFDDGTALASSPTRRWLEPLLIHEVKDPVPQMPEIDEANAPPSEEDRTATLTARGRDRFRERELFAVQLMQDQHFRVAAPLLEHLVSQLDKRTLIEWEGSVRLVNILVSLYYCLSNLGNSDGRLQAVFERICQLDPKRAVGLGASEPEGRQ